MGRRRNTARGAGGDARTALVVAVVAGTVLAALVLRSGGHVGRGAGAVRSGSVIALLAAAWIVGCLALYARHRARLRIDHRLGPVEQRLATALRATLLVAAIAVPVPVVLLHRFGAPGHPAPLTRGSWSGYTGKPRDLGQDKLALPPWLVLTVLVVAAVALVGAFVYAYRLLLAEYVRKPKRVRPDPLADAQLLADAVESGRRALLDNGDARAAVIACYAAMETSLAGSGVARHVSDSPNDLLVRAGASGLRTEGSASALTALFREARYSTHPMGDAHREQAAAALADIAEQLGVPGAGGGAVAGAVARARAGTGAEAGT